MVFTERELIQRTSLDNRSHQTEKVHISFRAVLICSFPHSPVLCAVCLPTPTAKSHPFLCGLRRIE